MGNRERNNLHISYHKFIVIKFSLSYVQWFVWGRDNILTPFDGSLKDRGDPLVDATTNSQLKQNTFPKVLTGSRKR